MEWNGIWAFGTKTVRTQKKQPAMTEKKKMKTKYVQAKTMKKKISCKLKYFKEHLVHYFFK